MSRISNILDDQHFLEYCSQLAELSTCCRSRCGSMIVDKDYTITLGWGYNSKPCHEGGSCFKDDLAPGFKSDKTCCVHAEQRAIMDALKKHPELIVGSRLYFIRIDDEGKILKAGKPYCTICSKMALDVGIAEFVLWHEEGITIYDTKEYNELSFAYSG